MTMCCGNHKVRRRLATLTALALLVGVAGCGSGRYPVTGRVLYQDGSPVTEGVVIGEAAEGDRKVMAQGAVQPDGSFRWGTGRPGDGAWPGKYRVVVVARALGEAESARGMLPAVDPKFSNPRTSGIAFDVNETHNEFNITVTRPRRAKP
jgi:hypothetical protein